MAGELDLELLASIASGGLGRWVEDAAGRSVYVKSEDCIGCLRDLQRFFRYDDPEARPAFFAVSKYNFARSDLVPLIVTYPEDYEVVYNALKVATFLTMPSSDPLVTTNRALQEEHMQAVREAFLAQDALAAVVGMLAEPLARHPRMDERDAALVQLVIAFLKNLVAIPAAPARAAAGGTTGTSAEAARRVKAGLLERLFQDNVMDLLLLLAQHAQQRPFRSEAPVLVEIFMHLFAGVEPQQLLDAPRLLAQQQAALRREEEKRAAAAAAQKAAKAKAAAAAHIVRPGQPQPGAGGSSRRGVAAARAAVANTSHLPRLPALPPGMGQPVMHKSMVPRHVAQAAPSRHAHSGAVYVRRHSDHSANIVVRHNPHRSELPKLPAVVDAKKAAAQKRDGPAGGASTAASTARPLLGAELLVKLDGYMQQFLDGAYDLLMGQVFKELQPGLNISRCSEADFLHFVRLATYCTRYVRLREERKLQAKLKGDAAGQKAGSPAAAAAGAAAGSPAGSGGGASQQEQQQADGQQQQEQQQSQQSRQQQEEEEASPFAAISATMGWDCFHWLTMLWILLSNMEGGGKQKDHSDKNWDLQHASVPLLKEMLLTLDLARVAGSTADRRAADRLQRRLLHDDLKESGLLPVLGRLIRGYNFRFQPRSHGVDLVETLHVVLGVLDRLSTAEPGGFKVKAAVRQGGGRRTKAAATPAQGEEEGDGAAGSPAGGDNSPAGSGSADKAAGQREEEEEDAAAERRVGRSGDPLDDDDEGRRVRATREVSFEAARRVRQECAHPAIVHFYAWLLQGYRTNAAFTNHAIVSFFRRIAEPRQLNLEPMLYQLSVLRLFEAILSDVSIKRAPDFQDLLSFCKQTVRNMFARMVPDLSELRQRAGQLEANLEARFNAADGNEDGGEADSAEQAARRETRLAQAELKARENAAKAMFVELLFWKGANVAEDVRNEYNWRGLVDPQEHKKRGGRRGRGSALGDDEGSDGEGQLGFASYRRKDLFREEDVAALRSEFERCNGHKDCLARLTFEFGGKWKKSQIGRQLKAMDLQRGKLTDRQVDLLRDKYEEVRGKLDCFQLLAEELNAGFTANQIKRQLTKLGIVSGRAKEKGLTGEQEELLRGLFAEHGGSGRTDRFELIAEGMEDSLGRLLKPAQVKRYLRSIGLLAARKRGKKDADFDALLAGSDDEEGGQPSQSLGGRGGGGGADSDGGSGSDGDSEDGSGSDSESDAESEGGFESAHEDLDGGASDAEASDEPAGGSGGGRRARNRAQQRLAKIERLQKSKRHDRADSPVLPATMPLGPEEASDSEGEGGEAAFQRRAAEAAAAASPASSGGGSGFVSLEDSDAEDVAGLAAAGETVTSGDGQAGQKGKRGAAQRRQPASKKQRRAPAAAGSDSDAGSGDDSDSGFASAQESEPESEGAPAAPAAAAQRTQRGKGGKGSKGKGGSGGTLGAKRKAEEEPAGPSSAQKRAALAALRAKRQGGAAALPATEPFGAWQESEAAAAAAPEPEPMDAENEAPAQQRQQQEAPAAAAKPVAGGRRLLKKGSGGGAAAAAAAVAPSGFEDLEDF